MVQQGKLENIMLAVDSSNPLRITVLNQVPKALELLRQDPQVSRLSVDENKIAAWFSGSREEEAYLLQKLVDAGNTVIVIEHNLDVLDCADHVIEMGPGGGDEGGQVVFTGTPDQMCDAATLTGTALAAWRRARAGDATRESFFNLPPLEKKREPFRVPAIPTRAMGRSTEQGDTGGKQESHPGTLRHHRHFAERCRR